MRADLQLERLLYILPVAARQDGVRIDELAAVLGVEPKQVLRDLEAAMTRAYYHPAGSIEAFTILIEGDVVRVHAPSDFRRPARLSQREALALGLGLRALAAEAEPPRRTGVLALAARLEDALVAPDDLAAHGDTVASSIAVDAAGDMHDVEYEPDMSLAFGDDGYRGVVADAIEQHRMLRITYLKPGDAVPTERRIAPYRLVYAEGTWYIAAHDAAREDFRFFRLDRVLDAAIDDESRAALPDVDLHALLADGIAYRARDDMQVRVRYNGTVARWIAEQHEAERQTDGSVVVTHAVADPGWCVRHVLQYGGAATVEAPAEARRWVSAAARRLADG